MNDNNTDDKLKALTDDQDVLQSPMSAANRSENLDDNDNDEEQLEENDKIIYPYDNRVEDNEEDEEDEDYDEETGDEYHNPFYPFITPLKNDSEQNETKDGTETVQDNLRPISAIAPRIFQQDETQVEISSTPAFQCLEELFQNGKLTGTKVAQLKAKYIELHMTLKKSKENEARLIKESKDYMKKLEENKEILQKAEAFPDNLTNEVLKLRAQYLKCENDTACSDERLYNLEYKLSGLAEDKNILDREYARMPKPHELEQRIEILTHQNMELSREINQRKEEINDLKQLIYDKNTQLESKRKEYKDLIESVENHKNDYVQANAQPHQIAKEIDKVLTEKDEINKEISRIENEYKLVSGQFEEIKAQMDENDKKLKQLTFNFNNEKNNYFEREKQFNDLNTELELQKEKEVSLQAEKLTLELSLKHILADKKHEYEAFIRAQKEKEKDSKNVKKLELQLKACQDSLTNLKLQHEKIISQKEQQPLHDTNLAEKRKELEKEKIQLEKELKRQLDETTNQKSVVETQIQKEENLLFEQSNHRIEVVEVTRLAAIKADEKEQKAREHMKAETRYKKALEDLKIKENQIEEHQKRLRELKIKLKEFAQMYDAIKSERNKYVNQIQVCTQKAAEMKEKLKILGNENEILRTSATQKEKTLQRLRLVHANLISERDSIRNEKKKQLEVLEELRELNEQKKLSIENYNNIVNYNEQEAVKLRNRYETCLKQRNERGVELIKRSEEVCLICEKSNAQEMILKNANIELQAREEEHRFLTLRLEEEKRIVELYTKQKPKESALQEELAFLRNQLTDCQDYLTELEKKVEDCNNPERIRFLEGPEETIDDIIKKLQIIEEKLAKVEEQCLEKDLILEQVNRLTERITGKVNTSKDDTLKLAKKVNKIQGNIKDTTKKMMAVVSELSIAQAEALKLQEEVKNKEILLEQYYNRMQKGEAPSEDIELQWARLIEMDERSKHQDTKSMSDDKVVYTMNDGYVTTAEPRPNAYIPQTDELPLPKPYGRLAPFKPQEPGSTMRHIKKPNPKPIEI